jgi:3-methyladenine DNA glycosylase AlkD
LDALKALGTAQNRRVYARHGISGPMFGVSFTNLHAIAKKIKKDQRLAEQLWASGNHDARVLATMIADRSRVDAQLVDRWRTNLDNYVLTDMLSRLACEVDIADSAIEEWCSANDDWTGQLGWNLVGHRAMNQPDLPDEYFDAKLKAIESEIHARMNRTRHSMNAALIAIGLRHGRLRKNALAVAEGIGPVEVDHGETGCQTPDARAYLAKALAYRTGKPSQSRPNQRKRRERTTR